MTLSIIIPTLNEEKILEKTLGQIHDHLTEFDAEIIVSDDGSTDRTLEIARRYGKVFDHKADKRTIGKNRNNGARNAHGDFLVFIDADMFVPHPNDFFRMLLADFAVNPHLIALTVKIKVFPEDANTMDNIVMRIANFTQWLLNNVLHIGNGSGEFQMVRRSAFEEVRGYQEHLVVGEDADLFHRLSKIGATRIEMRLTIYNNGRRAHTLGWPKVIWNWVMNWLYIHLFHRSYNDEWGRVG